ncbi:MAG: dipeptidase PepV [Anaerovoracaceae bacterium]
MDFSKEIEASMEALINDISGLCKINSVEAEPLPGMPFGKGPAEALNAALKIGEDMGFKTENFDNYVGHIEYGQGDEMVGILAHVDVVPAGEGWDMDPWSGQVKDGRIWGRGTLDDKGPLMTCLYAVKILRDLNIPLKKKIRFIIGTNEETDWGCMDYYMNTVKPELPTCAFSPDSSFPVTYAEMGILQYTLSKKLSEDISISGGNAFNAVPSSAQVLLPMSLEEELKVAIKASEDPNMYSYTLTDEKIKLVTKGIGAHAASLGQGKNAISYMMLLLSKLSLTGELKEIVDFYNENIGTCIYGEKMGIATSDEDSGNLTLNVGMISVENNVLTLSCDTRIPVTLKLEDTTELLEKKFENNIFEYQVDTGMGPLYVSKDSELVKTLMEAYRKVTGDMDSQPITAGGGTYSRTINNCVAFGCLLPDQEDTMHQANESLEIEKLQIWLKICIEAIYQLAK